MEAYKLHPGEVIILRDDYCDNLMARSLFTESGELLLTTEAIVFTCIKRNKIDHIKVTPLDDIQIYNGRPQVKGPAAMLEDSIEIYTNGGVLKYNLGDSVIGRTAKKWAAAITEAVMKRKPQLCAPPAPPVPQYAPQFAPPYAVAPLDVRKCPGCGAQIVGRVGDIGVCEYCGCKVKI